MEIREIKCKTALSKSNLPGLDYSLNPYRGCQNNCAYCYVPNVLKIKRQDWGSFVDVKKNIADILAKELRNKKAGVVGISTVTDPYQSIEKKYKLTRYCLIELLRYDFPINIQTKSNLVLRDIDLISKFSDIEVMFSIGTLKDFERNLLEPNASSISDRLNAIKQMSEKKINTCIFLGPIYPTFKLDDIKELFGLIEKYSISEIMIDKFNIKHGIIENIIKNLNSNIQLKNFFINSITSDEHYKKIRKEIKKEGLIKNIKIVDAFKKNL